MEDLRIVGEAQRGKPSLGVCDRHAVDVGARGLDRRRIAGERGAIGAEEEDVRRPDERQLGRALQARPLLVTDVAHQAGVGGARVRAPRHPRAAVRAAAVVADAEALHQRDGAAAETQEMPGGGQAHHAAADHDRAVHSLAHVVRLRPGPP